MSKRVATIERATNETVIGLTLNLDGSGECGVQTPIGFFNHMLSAFCKHGLFDLSGTVTGDLEVDQHHTIEDTGIVLGQAFDKALGNKAGIFRAGFFLYPMDETLAQVAVDFGGRPFLEFNGGLSNIPLVGGVAGTPAGSAILAGTPVSVFQTDTVADFWHGFATGAKCNMHIDIIRGRSDHHKIEAMFKAAAKAIRQAVSIDDRAAGSIPSTKGVIA